MAFALLTALAACGASRGALLTDFAGSYALYQQCAMNVADFDIDADIDGTDFMMWQRGLGLTGQFINAYGDADKNGLVNQLDLNQWKTQFGGPSPVSPVCFKLYLDPKGIIAGSITAIIDVPNPPGQNRLTLGTDTGTVDVSPLYTANVSPPNIFVPAPGRQRIEATVNFNAVNSFNPPAGPITIFGFQTRDNLPGLGSAGVQVRFESRPGNFITVYDPATNETTTFDNTQLSTQQVPLTVPLVLDVNTVTGAVSIRNPAQAAAEFNYYEITSLSGALSRTGWVSIDSTEGGDPPGVGWDEAGGVDRFSLAESNFSGTLPLSPGQSRSLGPAFNHSFAINDLRFFYSTVSGALIPGVINYNTTSLVAAAPEPGGLALALIAAAAGRQRSRRRPPRP